MTRTLTIAVAGLALLGLFALFGALYQVEEGQQAIVLQFGRPVGRPVTQAGLHLKLPFVQKVRRFEQRLLIWDGDPNQIPTKGREFIWVDTTARWRIADAQRFLESVATEAGAQSRLDDIVDSVVRDQVSGSELVERVRSGSGRLEREAREQMTEEQKEILSKRIARGREEITRAILAEAGKITPQYGIELVDVRVKRLNYVESVREKVYAQRTRYTAAKLFLAARTEEGDDRNDQAGSSAPRDGAQICTASESTSRAARAAADGVRLCGPSPRLESVREVAALGCDNQAHGGGAVEELVVARRQVPGQHPGGRPHRAVLEDDLGALLESHGLSHADDPHPRVVARSELVRTHSHRPTEASTSLFGRRTPVMKDVLVDVVDAPGVGRHRPRRSRPVSHRFP